MNEGNLASLAPMDRQEIKLTLDVPSNAHADAAQVRVRGNFGSAGRPVLSLRFVLEPSR